MHDVQLTVSLLSRNEGVPGSANKHNVASLQKIRNGKRTHKRAKYVFFLLPSQLSFPSVCDYIESCMETPLHRSLILDGPAGRIEAILWSVRSDPEVAPPLSLIHI